MNEERREEGRATYDPEQPERPRLDEGVSCLTEAMVNDPNVVF